MNGNLEAIDDIPQSELYMFRCRFSGQVSFEIIPKPYSVIAQPPPQDIAKDMVIPNNTPYPFYFPIIQGPPVKNIGGSVKVVDTRTFIVSEKISATEVEIKVGGMR